MNPTFSVIIPVLGEENRVNALIDHVRVVGYGVNPEIVAADGAADRGTLAAIDRPGVTAVPAKRGRGGQLNAGALAARGEVFVFLHADSRLPAGAFQAMTDAVLAGAAAGAFRLGIRSPKLRYRLIEAGAALRSALTRIPYGDQAQFVRRDVFEAVGGFPEIPIMEDVELMRRIKRACGRSRIALLPERVSSSARRWETEGAFFCTARNQFLLLSHLLGASAESLARHYPPFSKGRAERGAESRAEDQARDEDGRA